MVTSHIKGWEEKYSSQSDSRSKHDTETANESKSAALVRTLQVLGAVGLQCAHGHGGKSYLERPGRGSFTKAN